MRSMRAVRWRRRAARSAPWATCLGAIALAAPWALDVPATYQRDAISVLRLVAGGANLVAPALALVRPGRFGWGRAAALLFPIGAACLAAAACGLPALGWWTHAPGPAL